MNRYEATLSVHSRAGGNPVLATCSARAALDPRLCGDEQVRVLP